MKIAITGASGLVGRALCERLLAEGHAIHSVVREARGEPAEIVWDPAQGKIESAKFEGLDAVIHLAGENIAGRRWNDEVKSKIRTSRVAGTKLLSETLVRLRTPPRVVIMASAVGYYGNRGDEILREDSGPGRDFLADVCVDWEQAAQSLTDSATRLVTLRFGVVLSSKGGALKAMLFPFRWGLGGVVGSGRQFMSWIALADVVSIVQSALAHTSYRGAYNACSPNPVTNREFTYTLGKTLHRPTPFPLPAFVARLALGEMADALLLSSARAVPARLQGEGFTFEFPDLAPALEKMLRE